MVKFWKCLMSVNCSSVKYRRDKTEEMVLGDLEVFDSALADISILEELPLISEDSPWADQMVDMIQSCKLGIRFLRMFFWSLSLVDTDEEIRQISTLVNYAGEVKQVFSRKKLFEHSPLENARLEYSLWIIDLQSRIEQCKQEFDESCELLLQCSFKCNSFKLKDFLDSILENLNNLYKYKTSHEIVLIKNQIETLEKKLRLLSNLFGLLPEEQRHFEEMREFMIDVHAFAYYSSSLVLMCWVKAVDEDMAAQLNLLLVNVLQKFKPYDPIFKASYIRLFKEMKLGKLDSRLLGQSIQILLDLLFESPVDISKEDFQDFQESLMFVIVFLANPPDRHVEDDELMTTTAEIEVLIKETLYLVLSVDDMNGNFFKANVCLSEFISKVELVKDKIQRRFRDSFSYDFPKINGLGFFDFLLQNIRFLKEKLKSDTSFIPFAKYLIIKIEEELMSLRHYLDDLFEHQKEQNELKDTWLKVISLAYRTEYAINSCLVTGYQLWYNLVRMLEILDEIKVVKSEVKMVESRKTLDNGVLQCSAVALNKFPPLALGFNEMIVNLEDEVYIIVEKLIRGCRFFDIVAIVGMAGLGKTTMANKVYNSPMVRHHFHVFAYCIVSQVHNTRKILSDILCGISGEDDKINDMIEEDLAEMLRKRLKGQRYLIIMDDIWDVKAWDEVKRSLPNDQNGSRVIFTTRNHYVALQAKRDCVLHRLRFMSDEESWELLRKKVFRAEGCPPTFLKVGKMIAKNCKGLPLTIVLIAGVLIKTERSLSWWNKICETIGSYVSTEGFMNALELSYQHLPEHLKPCFLYFGAFVEDTLIGVSKLTLLWIAEGFVQNSNGENLKNVARNYLCELVDRSLVISNKRSSYGGIKTCQIHDLVHEYCQRKAQEENFFQFMDGYGTCISSSSMVCNAYRVCIQIKGKDLSDTTNTCSNIHSVLDSRKMGSHHYDHRDVSHLKLVQVMESIEELEWDSCITSLVHLRFISFPLDSSTKVLSRISKLWNLEFLILTGSRRFPLQLPATIWNLTKLKHVNVGLCYLSTLGVKKRGAYTQMVNLESFSSPKISSMDALEDLLLRSPSLQKLSFQHDFSKDFHFSKLYTLGKLEALKVSGARNLSLSPFIFPSSRIKKLSLSDCFLDWRYLSKISKLPCLEVLKLLDDAFFGLKWDMEDTEFPKLKFLKLQFLHLHDWIVSGVSFPSLEVLVVNRCHSLNAIPPCFGEVLTLKRIEVYASGKAATSVVEIQETQKDLGNEELEVIVSRYAFHK